MKTTIKFLVMIFLTTLLTGCWDITEPQRMYYINAVGVDYVDNEYEVFLQIINFADVAKSVQPSSNAAPADVGRAKGKTVEEAIYKLYRSSDQEIFWGHMRYLIFSERAMENERAIPVIDTFIRFRDTRYQIWIYCTTNPVNEVLLVSPILKNSLSSSKLSNPINPTEQETFVEPKNIREIVIGLNEPNHEVTIPYVSIKKDWQTDEEKVEETYFSGVGILSKDGFKGFVKDEAARGNQWMHNYTNQGEITFKLTTDGKEDLTVNIDKLHVKVLPIVKEEDVYFEAKLRINATVDGYKGKVNEKELKKHIIKEIQKEIQNTYKVGLKLDVDIYRLSEYLYRDNVKAWKRLEKDGKIPLKEDSIRKITIDVSQINPGRKTFSEIIKIKRTNSSE
ncbi:Ger(x)C family spore germination protein [Lysinibacillus sp. ZYM-1]|uniref:Ger(x)C family spore germination protein n=1 Tax=Lysinibacillus sp. ZYM-1 TaxID=1681184 RepID=UPI0006CE9F6F|nr:Ger(x)C family spore germination protein [Lysinibacillus sp. ZYM-1]KPN97125.1 spore gernimation protein [Lysinibacillus sp. ZYM-1]